MRFVLECTERKKLKNSDLPPLVEQVQTAVPLYEGKMVQAYDHRAADVVMNHENLHRAAQQASIPDAAKSDPHRLPAAQYWVKTDHVDSASAVEWSFAYKSVSAPTNYRTFIGGIIPKSGVGNSMGVLSGISSAAENAQNTPLLMANMNALAMDFVLRQKLQGQNLNWYILEQLPVIAPAAFEAPLPTKPSKSKGKQNAAQPTFADFIRTEVLALTYTAHDLAPFARDMGYVDAAGAVLPPFVFNEQDRAHRMARLDAVFMHLYGLSKDDAAYILSTFPIVRDRDEKAHGRFLTQDLILAYMVQLQAGELGHGDVAV